MKKEELVNGSIVVTREGYLGVVIKNDGEGYILYQEIGMDDLDLFNEDLTSEADGEEWDIMEVYGSHLGVYSFYDVEHNHPDPDWTRETGWERPTAEEREARAAEFEKQRLQQVEEMRRQEEALGKETISIVTQCFYGNRTSSVIRREDVKYFIRGWQSRDSFADDDVRDVELMTIPVPSDENIVIVYDQTKETRKLNSDYSHNYITCSIPELGVELHSRCFACRIDENGVFQSLRDGDEAKFIDYFPMR